MRPAILPIKRKTQTTTIEQCTYDVRPPSGDRFGVWREVLHDAITLFQYRQ